MAKNNNLSDYLLDIADAIREKKGSSEPINAQDFSSEIASIETKSGGSWTGHADAEGLKAIGWTDEDIAYYQEHGVNWNEECDEYHKVSDDNKALYGVLTASNISTYANRIVYLPKINTSGVTSMSNMFLNCKALVAIPLLNTSKVTNMSYMFRGCYSLVSIPPLDTSRVTNMSYMFLYCYSLVNIPQLDTSKVTKMNQMFNQCFSLINIPELNISSYPTTDSMFDACYSLASISLSEYKANAAFTACSNCFSLVHIKLKGAFTCDFSSSNLLSKESLIYIINNSRTSGTGTITLASYAYERLATDADVVEALTNHPNISIASA